ncbi:ABC transporter ATP-binding protein [Acutalibacter caecimuris]|uniref:ABC transporter ATP-binding protein n=1 Tax=Acutalibacter caecimuris TaxID=3093657 RepID=UPI002AC90A6A|nr:ABC transporter ATP-binding protein [Acutalibacter sp. M00118]
MEKAKKDQSTKAKKSSILRFYPLTKGLRRCFLGAMVTVVLSALANYMTPQVIRVTVDSVINDNPFALPRFLLNWVEALGGRAFLRSHIVVCAGAALLFAVIAGVTNYLSRMNLAKASEGTIRRLRDKLFSHIQRLPYAWHNAHQTGDIIQRCTQDVELIRNFVNDQLMSVVRTVLAIGISLTLMFLMNVQLSLIVLAFIPMVLGYSMVFFVLVGKKFDQADHTEGELTALVQENLTGVRVVRAFGRERFEIGRFSKKNQEFADLWSHLGTILGINWGLGELFAGLQALVIMVVGVFFVENGSLTEGEFLAFTAYNSMLAWPVAQLGRILSELSKTSISATRIFSILDAEEEQECPDPRTPPLDGDIVFDHVSFGYSEGAGVVEDVSFTIKAGSTFGILGATGSGKSTLMYLLDRLYELPEGQGSITIGGVDIRKMKREHLRRGIGMVLQEPFLFSKTFRESIADGSSRQDLDTVRRYARMAVIDDAIENFSQGYDTPIGERGVTISGGQKQRVAIARMLMQDTPIKVFDDSLSAVDMETDQKIRQSIKENVHGTTILIAHRITTLMNADQILVLDRGRVAQMGTHQQLAGEDGIYKRIYEMQKS